MSDAAEQLNHVNVSSPRQAGESPLAVVKSVSPASSQYLVFDKGVVGHGNNQGVTACRNTNYFIFKLLAGKECYAMLHIPMEFASIFAFF